MIPRYPPRDQARASFTLLETVIAIGLIAAICLEVTGVQGNAIYFSTYSRNVNQAIWIAKQMLSQVEYDAAHAESFKDVKASENERDFKVENIEDFKVTLTIDEWKLPITEILSGGLQGEKKEEEPGEEEEQGGAGEGLQPIIEQVFGDEPILKIAKVEVSWPEGVHRGSINASLLLANMQKVNEAVARLGPPPSQEKGEVPGGAPGGVPGGAPGGVPGGVPGGTPPDEDGGDE